MNRLSYLSFLVGLCWIVASCNDHDGKKISSSATAEITPHGAIRTRSPTKSEEADIERVIEKLKIVDARFPAPAPPWGMPSDKVVRVDVPGIIQLEDHRKVRLDGVRCDERGVGYLRRVLFDTKVSVVIIPSGGTNITPIPADVWTVDADVPQRGHTSGSSYSNVIEYAITSGWCEVELTATSKHNARNAALERSFQNVRANK